MPVRRPRRQLGRNEVHAWIVDLTADAGEICRYAGWLSADEHVRARQFRRSQDRDRFVLRRGKLREALCEYLDQAPGQLRFAQSRHGKLHLVAPAADIRFSVSHSDDLAAFGFASGHDLGVDIERIRIDSDVDQVASEFLSAAEQAQLLELKQGCRIDAFYRCWSCKEAFVKALGTGLSHPLRDFDVQVDLSEPACILATRPDAMEASRWSLHAFTSMRDYYVAVAARCRDWQLTVFDENKRMAP
jgi:4'-phosphopantetheinyl transferase